MEVGLSQWGLLTGVWTPCFSFNFEDGYLFNVLHNKLRTDDLKHDIELASP